MAFISTGVERLDTVLGGGLPESCLVAVAGLPGTGKTVLIQQMTAHCARQGRTVLYVTGLSEAHVSIVAQLRGFPFFDPALLGERIRIVNILPIARQGLGAVTSALIRTIGESGASLLVLDGFQSLRDVAGDEGDVATFLYELAGMLSAIKTTVLIVSEQDPALNPSSPEYLVADGVIVLRSRWTGQNVQRTVEVVKMRGVNSIKGPHSIQIGPEGMTVYPRPETIYAQAAPPSRDERVSVGVPAIDSMLGGGLLRGSATVVAGHPGTGKTLLGLSFLNAGARVAEPGVYASLVEPPSELLARSDSFGLDLRAACERDVVNFQHSSEANRDPDWIAWDVWTAAQRIGARRVVIDNLAALERSVLPSRLPGYLAAVVSHLRAGGATVVLMVDLAEASIPLASTLVQLGAVGDTFLYMGLESSGTRLSMRMSVLKMGGSVHDHTSHEYTIGKDGLVVVA